MYMYVHIYLCVYVYMCTCVYNNIEKAMNLKEQGELYVRAWREEERKGKNDVIIL